MFFLATKASSILFAVTISLLVLNSNNGISLLLNHPDIPVFANSESTNNTLVVTHGIASGDVTNDSAVVWSRSNQEAQMHVEYDTNSNFSQPKSMNGSYIN
jgi:phosphodiesterase/alkaline phosphatase D-like protein